ncbi:MAG: hypothetical protein HY281_02750 [Nitrospirae bacterium]|nr:hypothetical protein [Nitrospirota bacterium]
MWLTKTSKLVVVGMGLATWLFIGSAGIGQAGQSQIVIAYPPVSNLYMQQRQLWMQNRLLEDLSEALVPIKWPRQLTLMAVECGFLANGQPNANAFYNPQQHSITLCYEFADYLFQMFSQQTQLPQNQQGLLFSGALMFTILHEAGHAVIGEFNIPAIGREEDAADQFATIAFVADPNGAQLLMGPLWWFQLSSQQSKNFLGFDTRDAIRLYSDEHGVDEQRFYNISCLLYGSNPSAHQDVIASGMLTPERAPRCASEYQKIRRSWELLLTQKGS